MTPTDTQKKTWQGIITFLVMSVVFVLLAYGLKTAFPDFWKKDTIQNAADLLKPYGYYGILILGIVTPLLFLPRWPITFLAGFMYGIVEGALLANTASLLGAILQYYFARSTLGTPVESLIAKSKWTAILRRNENLFIGLFLLRATPISSFVLTNLIAGGLRISLRIYAAASFLGMLPSSFLYAAWGKTLKQPDPTLYLTVTALTLIPLAILALTHKKMAKM